MQRCWKTVKEERPTFTELKLKLKATRIALRKKQQENCELYNCEEENYINANKNADNEQ